jgi:hypothetical protein
MKTATEGHLARPRLDLTLPPDPPREHAQSLLPTSEAELVAKWEAEAARFQRFGAQVDGATVCRALLADLAHIRDAGDHPVLSLKAASEWSGYSEAHLMRLVKCGRLRTLRPLGTRGRLTFRRADLPRKPRRQHSSDAGVHELASRLGIRGKGGPHGRS